MEHEGHGGTNNNAQETVPNELERKRLDLNIRGRVETMQFLILELRLIFDPAIFCHSKSIKMPSVRVGVKISQGIKQRITFK